MAAIIAGISGAIGQALALKYLDEFPEQPVIGLCRNPDKATEDLEPEGPSESHDAASPIGSGLQLGSGDFLLVDARDGTRIEIEIASAAQVRGHHSTTHTKPWATQGALGL